MKNRPTSQLAASALPASTACFTRRRVLAASAAALVSPTISRAASPTDVTADPFALPPLPYAPDALEPHISRETMAFHHGKHHKAYLDNLQKMATEGTIRPQPLPTLIASSKPGSALHNNAAQAWNHDFFWRSMAPGGGGSPSGALLEAINRSFGSVEALKQAFRKAALGNFGSGWTWLVKAQDGALAVGNTSNAELPSAGVPLLTLDVWEHAYYIDYRNARAKFVDAYLGSLMNWTFADENFRA